LEADEVLIDDWAGRAGAQRRRLNVTRTLGVLAGAHLSGLLDFDSALAMLRAANFRLSAEAGPLARRDAFRRAGLRPAMPASSPAFFLAGILAEVVVDAPGGGAEGQRRRGINRQPRDSIITLALY
jgi:hypothetical protein